MLIGGQDPPGLGSYLVTEEAFGDFELQIEARPDWPVDTGILVRTVPQGNVGIQTLLDHRPHGGIGASYGNGLAKFHAYEYTYFGAEVDKNGQVLRLIPEQPSAPTPRIPLDYAAPVETFLEGLEGGRLESFPDPLRGRTAAPDDVDQRREDQRTRHRQDPDAGLRPESDSRQDRPRRAISLLKYMTTTG